MNMWNGIILVTDFMVLVDGSCHSLILVIMNMPSLKTLVSDTFSRLLYLVVWYYRPFNWTSCLKLFISYASVQL